MSDWSLQNLTDVAMVQQRLVHMGVTPIKTRDISERLCRCAQILTHNPQDADSSAHAFFVPGRIEVLGKHTDYAGGRTIVAAAERGFSAVARIRQSADIKITDVERGESVEFALDPDLEISLGHWSNYPMTVARRVVRNFGLDLRAFELAFSSDLPPAAGMSSSSAMIVMVFLAISQVNQLSQHEQFLQNIHNRSDLAGYLGTIENGQSFAALAGDRGVGTFGGSEDHTAILCSRPRHLAQFSYCPVLFERHIAVPAGFLFAIGVSGVVAEKTGAARQEYNRASRRASAVAELWREATGRDDPHLAAAVASAPDAANRLRQLIQEIPHSEFNRLSLGQRLDQFIAESEQLIPSVPDCLTDATLPEFGRLTDRSQQLGQQQLGNQIPQTVFLARSARQLGAAAASAFGAGFGGSVWALLPASAATEFLNRWQEAYAREFPEQAGAATFFTTQAGPPAFSLGNPLPFPSEPE